MVIKYQIKRMDLVKTYFYNLRHSQRTRLYVIGAAVLIFVYLLFLRYFTSSHLTLADVVVTALYAIGLIMLIPVVSFVTAKTQIRTLSINPGGIDTEIGSKEGRIPWQAVDSIVATRDRILITGKSLNVFSIPGSAFTDAGQRQQFIDLATKYQAGAHRGG